MAITPVTTNPIASGASNPTNVATRAGGEPLSVSFAPGTGQAAGPLDRVGDGIVSTLKGLEAARADRAKAMTSVQSGPANLVEAAKSELLAGPASKSLIAETRANASAANGHTDQALSAMTRSFDYAIETQLIVKTGSQLSTSASSLMRGQ